MTRRKLRECIFRILFSLEFNEASEMEEQVELQLEDNDIFAEEEGEPDIDYIRGKVLSVVEHIEAIDATIEKISDGWKINRIGKAELAILRLAIYEMEYDDDIPVRVAINEAVELAKLYCDMEAKSFINALLGKLTR